jgi:hypothetical protein
VSWPRAQAVVFVDGTCSGQTTAVEVNQTAHGASLGDRGCVCKESRNGLLDYLDHVHQRAGEVRRG